MTRARARNLQARVAASTQRALASGLLPDLEFIVYGTPGPQGSKKAVGCDGKGRAILVEMSKKVKPWRAQVAATVLSKMVAMRWQPLAGPVACEMVFTLVKPKRPPKRGNTVPDGYPDGSKLQRATEDALTTAAIWEDDGRVVEWRGAKRYPGEGADALERPGCVIRLWRLT